MPTAARRPVSSGGCGARLPAGKGVRWQAGAHGEIRACPLSHSDGTRAPPSPLVGEGWGGGASAGTDRQSISRGPAKTPAVARPEPRPAPRGISLRSLGLTAPLPHPLPTRGRGGAPCHGRRSLPGDLIPPVASVRPSAQSGCRSAPRPARPPRPSPARARHKFAHRADLRITTACACAGKALRRRPRIPPFPPHEGEGRCGLSREARSAR